MIVSQDQDERQHLPTTIWEPETPVITVIGKYDGRVYIQPSWQERGNFEMLSERTVKQMESMGAIVIDEVDSYLLPRSRHN